MTRKFPSPFAAALFVAAVLLVAAPFAQVQASGKKKQAPKPAAKSSAAADKRGRAASKQAPSKNESRAAKSKKEERNSRQERAADSRRQSKADRHSKKEERAERRSRADRRDDDRAEKKSGKMSKRERMAEARREAERRRREAAERARQLAIARAAAEARRRAADQALRDESAANIARDETTGEDLDIRRVAVEALGDRAGSVVVMNPKTGQVYTVVNQDWALRRGFKPCSTIKLVTGLAGLTESVIDPVQTVKIGAGTFSLDLTDSLALSNNGYFQRVGGEVGFEKMMDYARRMGLGQPTGINHHLESAGRLPSYKEGYAVNHMSSHGDDIEVTTVQLANMASTIANGGKLLVPHLPRTPQENVRFKREDRGELNVPKENLHRLLPGMIGAVNYGTARRAYDPIQTVAGKTGTCTGQGAKLGLFTSFAPVHDPQLSVAVITRGSGEGGKHAAAVAGEIYRRLNHRFRPRQGAPAVLANDLLAPRPKLDARKAAEASDEEREDEAERQQDAYVVREAGSDAPQTDAERNALQRTVKTVPRQAPAAQPATAPVEGNSNNGVRPRRVGERPE
ncbi:MAG TPA: penicillin-binding transpeptidase domain-containing protein [Pyrinomonadaceae bacterium]|nr:penicillin-binding transpeptidase domain-containing protein [Pyrinomonadaceae bacterium]